MHNCKGRPDIVGAEANCMCFLYKYLQHVCYSSFKNSFLKTENIMLVGSVSLHTCEQGVMILKVLSNEN
jgi:hypothetical protein